MEQGHIPSPHDMFDEFSRVNFGPFRVVAYPRNVYHSAAVEDAGNELVCDSDGGRLTVNLFFGPFEDSNVPLLPGDRWQ